jgi:hypothetical protein
VSRLRPNRMHLLLGLVVVLLATVPVLIPLVWTKSTAATGPDALRTAASAGEPMPTHDGAAGSDPTKAAAALPRAGTLASAAPTASTSATPSTPAPTTTAPTDAVSPPAPDPSPTATVDATTPDPTAAPRLAAAGPDLVVVSIGWSPQPPGAGQPVVFSAVVQNIGTDPTPTVTNGIAFSVDGTKVAWSANDSSPLGPGEQRTYTADGGNAWTATSGTHTVQAWADDLDRIPETDDDNNTATATVTVV